MTYYIIPVAVAALMVGVFLLTEKTVKNENAKQWIFKAMTLLFVAAFIVRYLSAKQVMMNTVGLNIRSPFGITGQNETAFTMLTIWFTYAAALHEPAHATGMECATKFFPTLPQVAVFDTAFHQTMPRKAFLYGIPYSFYEKDAIRRYGFHGTSHRFVTAEAAKILGKKPEDCCFITAHLGNGSSCSAILNGKCADTTMGFTPLDGLIMGTRSGSLDPAILFFISKKYGYDIDRLDKLVNKESGLLGLSGLSNDMRTLTQAASEGHVGAQIALETFCYKLTREIGGIAMALPRIDALVFTGGIGENSRVVRKAVMENLKILGYQIDDARNEDNGKNSGHIISKDGTPTAMVVATNEELLIALDTEALVK